MGFYVKALLTLIFLPFPLLITVSHYFNFYCDVIQSRLQPELPSEYDFILVGAGSAGSVLANRLSKHNTILVIEAGGDPIWLQRIPFFSSKLLHRPENDWQYKTVPQRFSSFAFENNVSLWPRGKSLGGTSNLNGLQYARGHPLDYDNWANLTGDPSWKYENVLPLFKRSIIYEGRHQNNEKHYGKNPYGMLYVSKSGFLRLDNEIAQGVEELGMEFRDVNGPQARGMDRFEFFQKDGKRWDSYTGFIKPILDRKNLYISRYSHATKIKFDHNNRAAGVWFLKNGVRKFARARKEVIVSAGAVDSPKLLMLSGIGPKNDLVKMQIKPRLDLPVGQNLIDHLLVPLPNIVLQKPISYNKERDFGIHEIYNFLVHGTGVFSSPAYVTHNGFLSSSIAPASWPDIQLYASALSHSPAMAKDFSGIWGLKCKEFQKFMESVEGKDTFLMRSGLVRPKSTGYLTLRDKNPASPPIIDPKYLEHPDDVKVLREGIEFILQLIYNTTAFQNLGAHIPETPLPGCEHHEFGSAPYWDCYVRHMAATIYHPVGTCKMGRIDDPSAVLDSNLRVIGTTRLRVADASIMPVIVNGNTHAPATMIGEKAADIIREYWSNQYLVCNRADNYASHILSDHFSVCQYSRLV